MIRTQSLESFGAEVLGYQLSGQHEPAAIQELRQIWMKNGVIVFRNQGELSEADLVNFSRLFGDLEIHVRREYLSPDNPEILYVSNMKDSKDGRSIGILSDHEVGWHHDQIYLEKPALGSLLHGVKLPASGGNTEFINLAMAFEALPESKRAQLESLRAVQSYAMFNGTWSVPTDDTQTRETPDVDHPLIRTHPETGRKAIYADPGMTATICEMDYDESRELLDDLFRHAVQPQFRYIHEWQPGDAVMWDNASTMHRRGDFDSESERLMKRTTILPPAERAIPF